MLILTLAASAGAPAAAMLAMESDAGFAGGEAVDPDYTAGQAALDAARWAEAAARFAATAAKHGAEADAATYWQAYAEKRQGRKAEALALIARLQSDYPKSAWIDDARALEVEVRGGAQEADLSADDELKLYALSSLLANDSPRAVELLRQFLAGEHPRKLQEQALFVLSQSGEPGARQFLVEIAQGEKRPELREKAIELLGISGASEDVALLSKLYASATDRRIKEKVLQSFLIADQKGLVFEAARGEKDPELRARAIELLGAMDGTDELRQLYRTETDVAVRRKVLEGLFVAGDVETLSTVARTETNRELRRKAIESLGVTDSERAAAELKDIYRRESDPDLKEAVLNAFFVQDIAEALIEVARAEKDPALRRAALQKLSLMDSPAATDFLFKHLQ
jgi:hypothetical protein